MEWLRFSFDAVLIVGALVLVAMSLIGTFRFHFVLNRMHAAALLDTGAVLLVSLAVFIAHGFLAADWKLLLLVMVLWIGSPISSHMLARLEVMTDKDLAHHLTVEGTEEEATGDDNA